MTDDTKKTAALEPGEKSSEYKLANRMMLAGLVLAVASSLGKVPFTPDQLTAYLANIVREAAEWSKALMPYLTIIYSGYLTSRHRLKKAYIEATVN